jgi:sulfonate transport system permease protein
LIVVELLASSEGIGYLMVWGRQLFQLDIVFVTIAVVGLSGMLMEWAANRVYARLVFWPQPPPDGWPGSRRPAGMHSSCR